MSLVRLSARTLFLLLVAGSSGARASDAGSLVDRTAIRYYAPETGGAAHPRFITARTLAFEARLRAMAEHGEPGSNAYQERHVRDATDNHICEELLAGLAEKLLGDLPPSRRPGVDAMSRIESITTSALVEAVGGRSRFDEATAAEGLEAGEVEAIFRRRALAAWYLDRTVAPLLEPSDEQLREVFGSSIHPFRGRSFEEARPELARWLVGERLRAAEDAFIQSARARLRIIVTR